MSVCLLGHLPELKIFFSLFSCSYREGGPAVVSSCFSPNSQMGAGMGAWYRWDSSPAAQDRAPQRVAYPQAGPGCLCSRGTDMGPIELGSGVGGRGSGGGDALPCVASLRTTSVNSRPCSLKGGVWTANKSRAWIPGLALSLSHPMALRRLFPSLGSSATLSIKRLMQNRLLLGCQL